MYEMTELKINVENDLIKDAFTNFILNYKGNISDYINEMIISTGVPSDAGIVLNADNVIEVYQTQPDKGLIMGELADAAYPFQIMQYSELGVDKRYLIPEKDRLILFYKQPEGVVDLKLGAFKNLADAVKGWDSEGVKTAIQNAENYKKVKLKDEKRLKRLGKAPVEEPTSSIEEAQVVENNG